MQWVHETAIYPNQGHEIDLTSQIVDTQLGVQTIFMN